MYQLTPIEELITRELERRGTCTLELLVQRLQTCTWNQVFMAVDTLSRKGAIVLRPLPRFQYLVSLAQSGSHAFQPVAAMPAAEGFLGDRCS